jgi:alpha-beta hydrolase superfamily lysophospholipase
MTSARDLLRSAPDPAADYADAEAKFAALQARDGDDVRGDCRSTLLTHGARTPRVYVLLHGLSNCPQQFVQFAPMLFERGANVLMPRIPRHGNVDLTGHELAKLTPEELCRFGDAVIDIARGLGEQVFVMGLSGGGVVASWIAQVRPDVERVVLVAPSFGVLPAARPLSVAVNGFGFWLFRALPNRMIPRAPGSQWPPHAYSAFASHGVTAMLQQARAVIYGASRRKPAARSEVVILNDDDSAVNNELTSRLIRRWQKRAPGAVSTYTFAKDLHLIHDVVDPTQPKQQTAYVYPILLHLLTGE